MKFFISILLIALLSFATSLYLPWWSIAIAAFIVTVFIHQLPFRAFLSGFISIFLLWFCLILWISSANQNLLAQKVAPLIISTSNPTLLILASSLLGALVAGFAALTGSLLVRVLEERKS